MRTKPQHVPTLIAVIALAAALTIAMASGVLARSTFQSSIEPSPETTETVPPTPDLPPDGTGFATETPFAPETTPSLTLTVEAPPIPSVPITVTPSGPGFLPAPTLVNPNTLVPGRPSPLQPGGQPLVGPPAPLEATPGPAPVEAPGPAQLIDSGVVALSYLWLCCGALLLLATALAIVWLSRRSKRR